VVPKIVTDNFDCQPPAVDGTKTREKPDRSNIASSCPGYYLPAAFNPLWKGRVSGYVEQADIQWAFGDVGRACDLRDGSWERRDGRGEFIQADDFSRPRPRI